MCSLANGEDPAEMVHNAAFHQDLHCLLRQKQSSEGEIQFYLEIWPLDIYDGPFQVYCIKPEWRIH